MFSWFQQTFQENSFLWLVLSSIMGGFIGASAKFIFDVVLPHRLQERREAIAIKRKYNSPILLSADSLRERFQNIIKHIDLIEKENWFHIDYYFKSTLFVVGQYYGWVQILRQTVAYLDFTTTKETQKFEQFLNAIENAFTDPGIYAKSETGLPQKSQDKWIYKYILQSLGALMITQGDQGVRVIDYATFCKFYDDSENHDFKDWFEHLAELFKKLKSNDVRLKRIVAIHAILNAFIDYLDPKHLQTKHHDYYWKILTSQEEINVKEVIYKIRKQTRRAPS